MKLYFKFLFFVFLAQHLLFLVSKVGAANFQRDGNGSGDLVTLNGSVGHFDDGLFGGQMLAGQQTSDVGEKDQSNGNVKFIGKGYINLTMSELSFYLCSTCVGKVIICYESYSHHSILKDDCPESSQCALEIDGKNENINFGEHNDVSYRKPTNSRTSICDTITITNTEAAFKGVNGIKTCKPKFDENGMIRLYVKPAEGNNCPVEAVGANIKYPEIITTPSPQTSEKPSNSTPPDSGEKTAESSLPWWGIVLICVLLLGIVIGIGIAVYCVCFKRPSLKKEISPTESTIPPPTAVISTNNAHESTITKTIQAPPKSSKVESVVAVAAKPEPEPSLSKEPEKKTVEKPETTLSKEPVKKPVEEKKTVEKKKHGEAKKKKSKTPEKKKEAVVEEKKKTTSVEQPTTTTQEVPAPPPPPKPTPTEPMPPATANTGPTPHIVPFSKRLFRSQRTSSVEEAMERNELLKKSVESVPDSLHRNYPKECDSVLVDQMKELYPDGKRVILGIEIVLFCVSISEMFSKMNDMVVGFVKTLSDLGIEFDVQRRITTMSQEGREYLQEPSTSGIAALFAFGAEYHDYIFDDMKIMKRFSIPHLMVVALQPRFRDLHRRKALTYIRRQLPFIRKYCTADEREAYPFPVPMIEDAFNFDPSYFDDLNAIDTDSEGRRRRKLKEDEYAAVEGRVGQRRRKKSAKKRF